MGVGLAVAVAICCGGHLALLLGLPALALLSSQVLLVAAAAPVAIAAIVILVWRRLRGCVTHSCTPDAAASAGRSDGDDDSPAGSGTTGEPAATSDALPHSAR